MVWCKSCNLITVNAAERKLSVILTLFWFENLLLNKFCLARKMHFKCIKETSVVTLNHFDERTTKFRLWPIQKQFSFGKMCNYVFATLRNCVIASFKNNWKQNINKLLQSWHFLTFFSTNWSVSQTFIHLWRHTFPTL